jgi:Spy/CpxP family protein refolding chaperone
MRSAAYTALLAACLIAGPIVFGQTQGSGSTDNSVANVATRVQRRVNLLTTVLSLNSSQQQQAMTIFTNAANANAPVIADLKTNGKNLAAAVKGNEPASTIKTLSSTIGSDAGQIVNNEASAYEQFYQILTPDQQTKAVQLEQETHGRGMMMGLGAF